jgi:MFS family permease
MVWAMWALPALPPQQGAPSRPGWAAVREGLSFLAGKRTLQMTFYADIVAMVFGLPRALFPAIAASWYGDSFGNAATRVGLLTAAPALGAALSAVFSGPLLRVVRHGAAISWAIAAWGVAITAFGLTRNLWLGLGFLAVAGAADNVSALYRTTMLQAAVPDEFRGRLQGLFTVVVAGGPRLGDFEAGAVAAVAGEAFSVISGGLACVVLMSALVRWHPPFTRYDSRAPAL